MQAAKSFRTVRKTVRITAGHWAEITGLPFALGCEVDVIVVGPRQAKTNGAERPIYAYTTTLTKRKHMPRYSMKQIEAIVHESRLSRD